MYEAFYGLREKPFNLTPDPRFLYLSEKHKEAFAHLLFGIKNRSGFVLVSGEIGTGKTTICRTLLSKLDENTEVAFIFNPVLSSDELLRKINEEFGIATTAHSSKGLVDELNGYLLDRTAKGKNCVLVIDEAQDLSVTLLEQIRLLSNLETETQKLLQIVLIGQPELMQNLALPELRQLNQRITARYHLKPLNEEETVQYIAFRLRVAGGHRAIRFMPKALKKVFKASGGTPRVINAICDRALLIGYTRETCDITPAIVEQASVEIRGRFVRPRQPAFWRRYLPSPSVAAAALLIVLAGKFVITPLVMRPPKADDSTPVAANPDNVPPSESASTQPVLETPPLASLVASDRVYNPSLSGTPDPPGVSVPARFNDVWDALDADVLRNAAVIGILRAWRVTLTGDYPKGDSAESLSEFVVANGLSVQALSPSLAQLLTVNRPALVKMAGNRQSFWIALLAIEGDKCRVTARIGETTLVAKDEFERRYLSQAIILWRDPAPGTPILRLAATGDRVANLQRQLAALGRLQGEPSGVYDEATSEAIKAMQAEGGLTADGKTGTQTRMLLGSMFSDGTTPLLCPKQPAPAALPAALVTAAVPKEPEKPAAPAVSETATPYTSPTDQPKAPARAVEKKKKKSALAKTRDVPTPTAAPPVPPTAPPVPPTGTEEPPTVAAEQPTVAAAPPELPASESAAPKVKSTDLDTAGPSNGDLPADTTSDGKTLTPPVPNAVPLVLHDEGEVETKVETP